MIAACVLRAHLGRTCFFYGPTNLRKNVPVVPSAKGTSDKGTLVDFAIL